MQNSDAVMVRNLAMCAFPSVEGNLGQYAENASEKASRWDCQCDYDSHGVHNALPLDKYTVPQRHKERKPCFT